MARRLPFDGPVGVAVRRHCAPRLGLPRHASAEEYPARRTELGGAEATRRFLAASGTEVFCVDTGHAPEPITMPPVTHEVVRLEGVAESLAAAGVEPDGYAGAFRAAAPEAVRRPGAVGVEPVAAYRTGFGLDPARPSDAEVTGAAARWLPADGRLADPVLVRHLLWTAVDLGLPLQPHTGFGDGDLRLRRAGPALLTDWLRLTAGTVPVLLLHCRPCRRRAACLAAVFEQVYPDLGLTLRHVGPARAGAVLAEALEIAPFRKPLYSSDAYGLAEFHHLGALAFRRGLAELLQERVDADEPALPDALRLAVPAGRDHARRVYRLSGGAPDGD